MRRNVALQAEACQSIQLPDPLPGRSAADAPQDHLFNGIPGSWSKSPARDGIDKIGTPSE